jgi:hypothetical protein
MMRRLVGLVIVAVVVAAGCDRGAKFQVYPVRGQVLYDGKPASGVQVYLFPTAAPGVPDIPTNPHGTTAPDGRFELGTYADADGAAEGSYQVVLYWPEEAAGDEHHESNQDRLFGWYTVARSKLTITVPAGGTELKPIRLPAVKGPPPESGGGIPGRN